MRVYKVTFLEKSYESTPKVKFVLAADFDDLGREFKAAYGEVHLFLKAEYIGTVADKKVPNTKVTKGKK